MKTEKPRGRGSGEAPSTMVKCSKELEATDAQDFPACICPIALLERI